MPNCPFIAVRKTFIAVRKDAADRKPWVEVEGEGGNGKHIPGRNLQARLTPDSASGPGADIALAEREMLWRVEARTFGL